MKNKTKPQQVSSKLENYLSFQNFRLALQLFISFSRTFRHPEQRNDNELLQIWKQEGLLLEYFTAQYIAALKHEMFIFLNGGWSDFNVHIRKKKGKTILHNVFNNSLGFFSFLLKGGRRLNLFQFVQEDCFLKMWLKSFSINFIKYFFHDSYVNGKRTWQETVNMCFKAGWVLLAKVI